MHAFIRQIIAYHNVNTLRPRKNGRRFADDTFKRIFLNEDVRISIKISLKFVPKGPINNNPALVQIMAWRRSSHYLNQWWLVYWRIYASLGLNELSMFLCWFCPNILISKLSKTSSGKCWICSSAQTSGLSVLPRDLYKKKQKKQAACW